MKLSNQELIQVCGGFCLVCAIIKGLKKMLRVINIKHLMDHLFVD